MEGEVDGALVRCAARNRVAPELLLAQYVDIGYGRAISEVRVVDPLLVRAVLHLRGNDAVHAVAGGQEGCEGRVSRVDL